MEQHYKDPPPGPWAKVATSDFVAFGVDLALEKHPELRVSERSEPFNGKGEVKNNCQHSMAVLWYLKYH